MYVGKSVSKIKMDIWLKQTRVLIWKILLFLNIISLCIEAIVSSFHKPLLSEPGGDLLIDLLSWFVDLFRRGIEGSRFPWAASVIIIFSVTSRKY
jgi:hypothetical protein